MKRLLFVFATILLGCSGPRLQDTMPAQPLAPLPLWDGPADWGVEEYQEPLIGARYRELRCRWCGRTEELQVHHIIPVRMWNDPTWTDRPNYTINDPENLVTLCRRCHLVVGHRGNYTRGMVTNFWKMLEAANK